MKQAITLLLLLSVYFTLPISALSQQLDTQSKAVRIGEPLPGYIFKGVANRPGNKVNLEAFKGKPIIFDFWPTWCLPCVKALPKLDSLQHVFGEKVQIIPVCYDNKERMEMLFNRMVKNKVAQYNLLPRIFDSLYIQRFQQGNFFSVWVDAAGIVRYYCGSGFATAKNVQEFINSGKVSQLDSIIATMAKTQKQPATFSRERGLLVGGNGGPDSSFTFRSILTGYQDGIPEPQIPGYLSSAYNTQKVRIYNAGLLQMYGAAYRPQICPRPILCGDVNIYEKILNRPVLLVRDQTPFKIYWNHPDKDSIAMHRYCYELSYPKMPALLKQDKNDLDSVIRFLIGEMGLAEQDSAYFPTVQSIRIQKMMQQDLHNNFGYNVRFEKIKYRCLNLVSIDGKSKKLLTRGGAPKTESSSWNIKLVNMPVSKFIGAIWYYNQYSRKKADEAIIKNDILYGWENIFINKTGLTGNIDIELNGQMESLDVVKGELAKLGLGIEEGETEIYAVIIRD